MNTSRVKIHFLLFLLVLTSYFNSCQSPHVRHNEADRQSQAREILKQAYDGSVASRFEKDPFFADYIEHYLKMHSRQLAGAEIVKTLLEVSQKNKYDPIFLLAIIKTESQFNPLALGSAGEIGLMQIKPETAKWICAQQGMKWKGKNALKNPHYNLEIGALYFKYLKKSLRSQASKYITAYNTGIGKLSRMPSQHIEKNRYFSKVLFNYLSIYQELEKIKMKLRV